LFGKKSNFWKERAKLIKERDTEEVRESKRKGGTRSETEEDNKTEKMRDSKEISKRRRIFIRERKIV